MVSLHKNARTTPLIRAEIATSTDSARVLAERYGISEGTVYKWKHRKNTTERSHTAHRLQTRLTPEQRRPLLSICAGPCCCRWMICWPSRMSSSARMSPARALIAACAATGSATSMP